LQPYFTNENISRIPWYHIRGRFYFTDVRLVTEHGDRHQNR